MLTCDDFIISIYIDIHSVINTLVIIDVFTIKYINNIDIKYSGFYSIKVLIIMNLSELIL
jgi:hypothetical protein